MRLLAGMRQQPGGVQLLDRYAAAAISNESMVLLLMRSALIAVVRRHVQRPVQLCHMPSSNTARLTARNSPLAVIMTSVGVTPVRVRERQQLAAPASTCAA